VDAEHEVERLLADLVDLVDLARAGREVPGRVAEGQRDAPPDPAEDGDHDGRPG
jgi:hypothetical protein